MNCKQARGKLALLIGNDLEGSAMQDVQKHLGECPGCREHLKQLSSCLDALQVPATANFGADGESLWPKLSVRLASPSAGQKPHRLSGWGPTLTVAAACTAMFWLASRQFVGSDTLPTPAGGQSIELSPVGEPLRPEIRPYIPPQNGPILRKHPSRQLEQESGTIPSSEDGRSSEDGQDGSR